MSRADQNLLAAENTILIEIKWQLEAKVLLAN